MEKLSKSKLREYAKEEAESARKYCKLGLKSFAQDEAKHARFFKMLSKRK